MPRFFLEVAYKGTKYCGFQVQENAQTIQSEVEKAFATLHRRPVSLTGSSRTDAGVHALQNYFHFDDDQPISPHFTYKMNAILPRDIVAVRLLQMPPESHSRFEATSREYEYRIYREKNPFLQGISLFYPYALDLESMQQAAALVQEQTYFFAFSKTNTQVKNFYCTIHKSQWFWRGEELVYNVEGNRFLRGMVRLLTATMLKVGRGKLTLDQFAAYFSTGEKCGHSIAADGLFLKSVRYPAHYFEGAQELS
ncbi:tRNA pseudouridine(38-40) synthase TruA [Paraflavisolibacter sp. H34]|uniref:tRNA pseudouridine(38-40) synthase TruA n=1 Tax=Huijunlia imazamoxiresistens TaxID=3127457 RepID=UPI00301B56D6